MDNLEWDDPWLVAAAKRLKLFSTTKAINFTRNYKPAESNWEDKDSVEKATARKKFLILLKIQAINQKSCFLL